MAYDHPRPVRLRFDRPGQALIRVRGRDDPNSPDAPSDTLLWLQKRITVVP